jgi:hypothetical protein
MVASNLTPVESDGNQRQSGVPTKELIYHHIVGCHPRSDGEHTEKLGEETRDEIVDSGAQNHKTKPPESGHFASNNRGVWLLINLMHGIKKSNSDQVSWPDHGRWIDYQEGRVVSFGLYRDAV